MLDGFLVVEGRYSKRATARIAHTGRAHSRESRSSIVDSERHGDARVCAIVGRGWRVADRPEPDDSLSLSALCLLRNQPPRARHRQASAAPSHVLPSRHSLLPCVACLSWCRIPSASPSPPSVSVSVRSVAVLHG